jgi:hypothetical protein
LKCPLHAEVQVLWRRTPLGNPDPNYELVRVGIPFKGRLVKEVVCNWAATGNPKTGIRPRRGK